MKDIPKPVLIVLVVVLVLFVVFVVMGATAGSDRPDTDPSPDWTDDLGKTLVKKRAVTVEEVSGCRDGSSFPLRMGPNCTATIAAAEDRIRDLRLQWVSGLVTVTFHQLDQNTKRSVEMPQHDTEFDFDVYRDGAELTFSCAFGECVVNMVAVPED